MRPFKQIGSEEIHKSSWEMGAEIVDQFKANLQNPSRAKTPLLFKEMQGGKTETIIATIDQWIEWQLYAVKNRDCMVLVISNVNSKTLEDQTSNRLTLGRNDDGLSLCGARLDTKLSDPITGSQSFFGLDYCGRPQNLRVVKAGQPLSNFLSEIPSTCTRLLVVVDEAHLVSKKEQSLDRFFRGIGVSINQAISEWPASEPGVMGVDLLLVSATPFAHLACTDLLDSENESLFRSVWREPDANQLTVCKMLAAGRLHPVETIIENGEASEWFADRIAQFLFFCETQGNGYLILRLEDREHFYRSTEGRFEFEHKYAIVKRILGDRLQIETYHCKAGPDGKTNIPSFIRRLSREPARPTLLLIKGAARVGMTIKDTRFIRMAIESESANTDTAMQGLVGRFCGFGKVNDTFPIFCPKRHAEDYARFCQSFYADHPVILPKGANNRREEADTSEWILTNPRPHDVARAQIKKARGGLGRNAILNTSTYGVKRTSDERDLCASLLAGHNPSPIHSVALKDDGPRSDGKFGDSYARLMAKYPESRGMTSDLVKRSCKPRLLKADHTTRLSKRSALRKG